MLLFSLEAPEQKDANNCNQLVHFYFNKQTTKHFLSSEQRFGQASLA